MTAYQYYWQNRVAEFRRIPEGTEFSLANLAPDRLIVGDAETCVREFHRWKDATSADYLLLRLRHAHSGAPPHAKIMEPIKLCGASPLPHCQRSRSSDPLLPHQSPPTHTPPNPHLA